MPAFFIAAKNVNCQRLKRFDELEIVSKGVCRRADNFKNIDKGNYASVFA